MIDSINIFDITQDSKNHGYQTSNSPTSRPKDHIQDGARCRDLCTELREENGASACAFEDSSLSVSLTFYTPKTTKMPLALSFYFRD